MRQLSYTYVSKGAIQKQLRANLASTCLTNSWTACYPDFGVGPFQRFLNFLLLNIDLSHIKRSLTHLRIACCYLALNGNQLNSLTGNLDLHCETDRVKARPV
jgi:hypothetical protein